MAVSETLALDVRQALNSIGQVDKALTDAAVGFQSDLDKATADLSTSVEVDAESVDDATRSVDKLNDQLTEEEQRQEKATAAAKAHDAALDKVGRQALIAGAALAAAFTVAIAKTIEFDSAMSLVQAITGATGKEFERLRESALAAGEETVFTATEAANAQGELAKAGVTTADIMGGALKGSLDLAAAGALGLEEAAVIAAQAMTAFQLSGKDVSHIADVLASGANKGVSSVSSLGEALGSVGPLANQFQIGLEDTVGVLALFEQNGIRGSEAGTNLRRVLLQLAAPTKDAAALMEQYGIDVFNTQGEFIGLAGVARELQEGLQGVSTETRQATLDTLFGSFAIQGANVLYREGEAGVTAWSEAVNDAGAASRFSAVALDNLGGDMERLGGAFETALINSGSQATGVLRELAQTATAAVTNFANLPDAVQIALIAFTGLSAVILLSTGALVVAIPKYTAAKTALIEMGGAAGFAGQHLGKMLQLGSGLAGFAAGITLIGTSTIGTATGMLAMVAAGAQIGGAFGHPAIGAAAGLITGIGVSLLKGGESAEEMRKRIAGLATELDGLGKKQAAQRFVDEFAKNAIRGDDVIEGFANQLKELSRSSPAAAQRVVDGFAAIGGSARFSEKELARFQATVDKGTVAYQKHAQRAAEAAAGNQAVAGTATALPAAVEPATESVSGIADAFSEADDAASGFDSVIAHIFGIFINSEKANLAFLDSLEGIRKSFKENGATLDDTTEKGRANRNAIIAATDASIAHAEAIYKETGNLKLASGALGAHAQQLFDTAIQAGLSEQQALDYAASLLHIPPDVRTGIHNTADLARAASETLEATYNRLDGRVIQTTLSVGFKSFGGEQVLGELARLGLTGLAGGGMVKPAAKGAYGSGMFWVGEQGPELFRPTTPGKVIPHGESMATEQAKTQPTSTATPLVGTLIVQAPLPTPVAVGMEAARRLRAEMFLRGR